MHKYIKLGVFGGSFDPPHKAHLELVKLVVEKLELDHVLVTVANDPWQKSAVRQVTDSSHRLEMARLLFSGYSDATVTDIEFQLGVSPIHQKPCVHFDQITKMPNSICC